MSNKIKNEKIKLNIYIFSDLKGYIWVGFRFLAFTSSTSFSFLIH